jgi:hypothetical protein
VRLPWAKELTQGVEDAEIMLCGSISKQHVSRHNLLRGNIYKSCDVLCVCFVKVEPDHGHVVECYPCQRLTVKKRRLGLSCKVAAQPSEIWGKSRRCQALNKLPSSTSAVLNNFSLKS